MSSETDLVAIEAELDAVCTAYVAGGHAPGLVYGLVGADGLVHSLGVGRADDDGRRPDEHTRFPVASISKAFTAAALLLCRDRGWLHLDDPITTWVPELRLVGPATPDSPPTLRELASMSGGLTEDNSWTDVQIDMTAPALLDRLAAGVRLAGLPGVTYDYANLGFALLQLVVERASGEPFVPFVTTELIEPLGLVDTSFVPTSHGPHRLVTGYTRLRREANELARSTEAIEGVERSEHTRLRREESKLACSTEPTEGAERSEHTRLSRETNELARPTEPTEGAELSQEANEQRRERTRDDDRWVGLPVVTAQAFAGAAGMVSTVADLARWVAWLSDGFTTDGTDTGPLSRASRRELQRVETVIPPTVTAQPEGTWSVWVAGYGLGLVVEHDLRHGVIVTHSGSLPGYRLHVRWHPTSRLGLVLATNSHRGDPGTLAARSFARLLTAVGAPARTVRLWPETVAARRDTETLIRGWDDSLAARLFAENVEVDQPLVQRRAEIERLVAAVGPLRDPLPDDDVISTASPAEVTWSIPAEHGELVCMVHLTGTEPVAVQELVVQARTDGLARAAAPVEVSPRRSSAPALSSLPNVRVQI